jgi:hypothetical protein
MGRTSVSLAKMSFRLPAAVVDVVSPTPPAKVPAASRNRRIFWVSVRPLPSSRTVSLA